MPDEDKTETAPEETAPPAYTFPFPVPADLSAESDDALTSLQAQVREHAQQFAGKPASELTDESIAALRACKDLAVQIRDVVMGRRAKADEATQLANDIADAEIVEIEEPAADLAADTDDDEDEPGEGDEPSNSDAAAATGDADFATKLGAALMQLAGQTGKGRKAPTLRDLRGRPRQPQLPTDARPANASMVAASGAAGFSPGQTLDKFSDAAKLLSRHLDMHPSLTAGRAKGSPRSARRPVTVYGGKDAASRVFELKNFVRIPGVELRREFPDELRVRDGEDERGYAVAEHAADHKRLPGGSLVASARLAVKRGRALTAAAGWCAPSETIYELCELETLDGLLDLPEMQTTRGGWNIPEDGGPNFATIWDALGDSGDTHLSEAEVIAESPAKVCTEIPCPDFDEVRLGVDYFCLTGGLLQRRGYPEAVARFGRGATVALAHKINRGVISNIVTASGPAKVVPADPSGDDAASGLLSAVDLAIEDAKYRNRQEFSAVLEAVLPHWVLVNIRAALARRRGVKALDVTDAEILEWFTIRKAVPRFVYDWQDAFSGLASGPGGSTPLGAMPTTAQFLIYPAGTWVKAVQDVVSLDTIYDSTKLTTNEYTAVFVEDGWATLQMCPLTRLYTAYVDPSGVTGCCPGSEVS